MENNVATIPNAGLARMERISFTDDQVALIRSQIAPNAKPDELALFLYQCKRTGLDPLARQMYCIHRGGKMTIQTSIDGIRVVAERSGDYGGQDAPEYLYTDTGALLACRVTVYRFRGDIRYPAATGIAYMAEYNAGGNMWGKMPHAMLAKCSEALALRKAYPQDLSGLYTGDEMEQAGDTPAEGNEAANEAPPPGLGLSGKPMISPSQYDKLLKRVKEGELAAYKNGVDLYQFTPAQLDTLMSALPDKNS